MTKLADLTRGLEEEPVRPARARVVLVVGFILLVAAVVAFKQMPTSMTGVPPTAVSTKAEEPRKRYSRPVQELMAYAEALKRGRASFIQSISGEEAAKQMGYTRLFATAYEELRLAHPKSLAPLQTTLAKVIEEEQAIDYLMPRGLLVAPIAFLRALQNGDIDFPAGTEPPAPAEIIARLTQLHSGLVLDPSDPFFALVYGHVQEVARVRVSETGSINVYEVIRELRRAIITVVLSARGGI